MRHSEAFESAMKTGKVAISGETARLIASYATMMEAFEGMVSSIADALSETRTVDECERVTERLAELMRPLEDYAGQCVGMAVFNRLFTNGKFTAL